MPVSLELPTPSTEHLQKAPLELVVCQVRHENNPAVSDPKKIVAIRQQLGIYSAMEPLTQQQIELVATPGGTTPIGGSVEERGWRLRTADGAWTAALMPDYFALECTGYTTWSEFRQHLEALARAVTQHLAPSIEFRLGVRYVDRISDPEVFEPQGWSGLIAEHLLGPLLDQRFGPSITAAQQLVQMSGPDGHQVLLRHGTEPKGDGKWPYVLDTDCSRAESRLLIVEDMLEGAEQLHKLAVKVFQSAVTPELLQRLK